MSNALFDIPIIFEDAHIVAVNKPPNMLSTPGNLENITERSSTTCTDARVPGNRKRRFEEWSTAVRSADRFTTNSAVREQLKRLKGDAIPRKEAEFKRYVQRTLKEGSEGVKQEMWTAVCEADANMHKRPISSIPLEYLSAFEILSNRSGSSCPLYPVHRYSSFRPTQCRRT